MDARPAEGICKIWVLRDCAPSPLGGLPPIAPEPSAAASDLPVVMPATMEKLAHARDEWRNQRAALLTALAAFAVVACTQDDPEPTASPEAALPLLKKFLLDVPIFPVVPLASLFALSALPVTTGAPSASSKLLSFVVRVPCLILSVILSAIDLADL